MSKQIKLLDCTLRDGAYINNSDFGDSTIRGIIQKMHEAHADVIECGWLKDKEHVSGSSYFHVPQDIESYIMEKDPQTIYSVMIDWDRYDTNQMPEYDGKSINAVRVVFPHGKHREGIKVGEIIRDKGYKVLFQAANTLAYNDEDLKDLAECMNKFKPVSLSIVDTFGAMYFDDLDRIANALDHYLDKEISIGFHAHNNQQLAFALCIRFVERFRDSDRVIMVDSSLSGMGRGAGNATTELLASYLNRKQHGNYDLNAIMDAIDIFMAGIHEKYTWGYSTPYFIAGMYQCHVNNIAYLLKNHRTNARDMRTIIESLSMEDRRKYDYDLLERKYLENQARVIDDSAAIEELKKNLSAGQVLLIAPGRSTVSKKDRILSFIEREKPVSIAVNALNPDYLCDYSIFTNTARYEYARNTFPAMFKVTRKILFSNIKTEADENEIIVSYNAVIKRGWEHFDNAVILTLRLMNRIDVSEVAIAGFDGFKTAYNESYADVNLPTLNPGNKWEELNEEIADMYRDFTRSTKGRMNITFVTESRFENT